MNRIIKYVLLDIIKNRLVLGYALILALVSWSLFNLEDNSAKGVLSLTNIVLLIVPLVSIIFSTIYIYNASEFIELLVSQPLKRPQIWMGFFAGLTLALMLAFLIGVGLPLLIYADGGIALILLITGLIITGIFVALAMLVAVLARDKARGIGLSIMVWLFFALIFDGLMLLLLFQFSDYPIEKTMIGLTSLSPIDLARILILLRLDVSALMGFTGALFKEFFGSETGEWVALMLMVLWILIPFWISLNRFKVKDL
ncbi:MAG: ABC transporter permease subunit [Saprospiraceae bacterium]|nr:ABC transporter permease subunit [Saprospiraceae bacterium]